ncbi:hypothetical protein FNYG_10417 [Fusarium nygamai]|uniref:Uncharacterized protein n=1 Tax=Gibberella nygamai TaxID=42673 RepID=A0A2K0W259_GIBNY|nr:hypothetical protein FNYG_10417 [Fusarium nygamai]
MRFSLLLSALGAAAVEIPAQNAGEGLYRRSESASLQPAAANTQAPAQDGYFASAPEVQTSAAKVEPETTAAPAPQVTSAAPVEQDDTSVEGADTGTPYIEDGTMVVWDAKCGCPVPVTTTVVVPPPPVITDSYPANDPTTVDPPPETTTEPLPPPPVITDSYTRGASCASNNNE